MVIAKCPLRISLIGGSTDLVEFVEKFGKGSVISFTPNLYTYVTIHDNNVGNYIINCTRREEISSIGKIKNNIIRESFRYFETPPCTITFNTNIPSSGSGLASSSSFTISTIKAICLFQKIKMTHKEICDLSFKIERNINKMAGYQDVYGCGVGSFKKINFHDKKTQSYNFLDLSFITNKYSMALINTGLVRKSTNILKTIDIEKSKDLLPIVEKMEKCITNQDEEKFFDLFNQGWIVKKRTSKEIMSNEKLINLENVIMDSKMIKGLKLCGAGGGGYFFLFFDKKKEKHLKKYMKAQCPNNMFRIVEIETDGVKGETI
jgi:D-glycero-alpha-D-manno-heptose-7-phosphate kinase